MDNISKITPLPWKAHYSMSGGDFHHIVSVDAPDNYIAKVDAFAPTDGDMEAQGKANAAYIVMAVNMHGEMLEALERVDELWSVDALDYSEEMHMDSPVGKVWALVKNAISKTTLVGGDNGKNS